MTCKDIFQLEIRRGVAVLAFLVIYWSVDCLGLTDEDISTSRTSSLPNNKPKAPNSDLDNPTDELSVILFFIAEIFVCILIIFNNTLVISLLITDKHLCIKYLYLFHLSVNDLVQGLTGPMLVIALEVYMQPQDFYLCVLSQSFISWLANVSLLTLCCIYVDILFRLRRGHPVQTRYKVMALICIWLVTLFENIVLNLLWHAPTEKYTACSYRSVIKVEWTVFVNFVGFYLCVFLTMLVVYVMIFKEQPSSARKNGNTTKLRREQRLTRPMLTIIILNVALALPHHVTNWLLYVISDSFMESQVFQLIMLSSIVIFHSRAFLNAIIYCLSCHELNIKFFLLYPMASKVPCIASRKATVSTGRQNAVRHDPRFSSIERSTAISHSVDSLSALSSGITIWPFVHLRVVNGYIVGEKRPNPQRANIARSTDVDVGHHIDTPIDVGYPSTFEKSSAVDSKLDADAGKVTTSLGQPAEQALETMSHSDKQSVKLDNSQGSTKSVVYRSRAIDGPNDGDFGTGTGLAISSKSPLPGEVVNDMNDVDSNTDASLLPGEVVNDMNDEDSNTDADDDSKTISLGQSASGILHSIFKRDNPSVKSNASKSSSTSPVYQSGSPIDGDFDKAGTGLAISLKRFLPKEAVNTMHSIFNRDNLSVKSNGSNSSSKSPVYQSSPIDGDLDKAGHSKGLAMSLLTRKAANTTNDVDSNKDADDDKKSISLGPSTSTTVQ